MAITHHTTPIVIPALDTVSTTAQIQTGTVVQTNDGGSAIYVQAASQNSQYNAVIVNPDFTTRAATTNAVGVTTTGSRTVGWAQTSIASGSYGWVQLSGKLIGKVAADAADHVPLFTTATVGVLDDATISGYGMLAGVVVKTSQSTASQCTLLVPNGAHVVFYQNPQ